MVIQHQQGSIDQSKQIQSRRLQVLVVDDFRNVAEYMASMMRILGHEAQIALDGATASMQPERANRM